MAIRSVTDTDGSRRLPRRPAGRTARRARRGRPASAAADLRDRQQRRIGRTFGGHGRLRHHLGSIGRPCRRRFRELRDCDEAVDDERTDGGGTDRARKLADRFPDGALGGLDCSQPRRPAARSRVRRRRPPRPPPVRISGFKHRVAQRDVWESSRAPPTSSARR